MQSYLPTTAVQNELYNLVPQPSAWKATNAKIKDPYVLAFAHSIANGRATPAIPQMTSVWDAWGKAMTGLFHSKDDPATLMKTAATAIRAQISK